MIHEFARYPISKNNTILPSQSCRHLGLDQDDYEFVDVLTCVQLVIQT